jgi:hypothetical protein
MRLGVLGFFYFTTERKYAMTVENPDEGNQTQPAGGAEQPTSQTSGGEGQPLPEYVRALENRLIENEKLIKGFQKGTDKQIGQIRGDVKRILELKEQGLSEAQIRRELEIDALLGGSRSAVPEPAGGTSAAKASLDVQGIDTALELPANDARVTDLKLKHGSDPVAYLREAAKLKVSLPTNEPTPAEQPLPTGGVTPVKLSQTEIDAKLAKYEELFKNYSQNRHVISALESELRKAGAIK